MSDCRGEGFAWNSSSSHTHLLLGRLILMLDPPHKKTIVMLSFVQTSSACLAVRFPAKNGCSWKNMPGIQEHFTNPPYQPLLLKHNIELGLVAHYHDTHSRFSSLSKVPNFL